MGLRPRFTTPLSRARDTLARYLVRPFEIFQPHTRLLIGFGFLVIVTTLLLFAGYSSGFAEDYKEGDIVRRTVVAPADITTVDIAETEKRRAVARESARPVFNFDSTRGRSSAQSFRAAWEDLKHHTGQKNGEKQPTWSGEGGAAVARAVIAHGFDDGELDRLAKLIEEIGDGYIYDDGDSDRLRQEIVLVDVRNPAAQMIVPSPRTQMRPLTATRRELELRVLNLRGWSQEEKTALVEAMKPLIRPNVVLDQTFTATARETEANKIRESQISLKRNQIIAREGEPVTPGILAQFSAIKSAGRSGRPWHYLIGLLIIVFAIYWSVWKFTEHRTSGTMLALSKRRAFALVGSAIVVETALMRVGLIFGDSVAARMVSAPFNDPTIWNFAIPFAAAALLVAMLVDTQLAFLTGIVTALFAGMLAPSGIEVAVYAMISSAAAIYGIGRYRERQSVTLAGFFTAGANVVMALALIAYAEQALSFNTLMLA
ncbi:MAG TPA: hypothetical protein VEW46_09785, partial [Pyrinomonadaceae bacterium]|nr:hypothetical protein [Pyrinomonadaceae bacterium]